MASDGPERGTVDDTLKAWQELTAAAMLPDAERQLGALADALIRASTGGVASNTLVQEEIRRLAVQLLNSRPRFTAGALMAPRFSGPVALVLWASVATLLLENIARMTGLTVGTWGSCA